MRRARALEGDHVGDGHSAEHVANRALLLREASPNVLG